ncbi:MAG: hypothetical protein JSW63_07515 [Ignavibacterium sp.]|nr:MAG: hypothetical protein JSW63_07515 [Ignavibacterium sp.]
MIKKISLYILLAFCVFFFNAQVFSQTLGFGCLGFVGGYGGVVYQKYNAEGLNNFVKYFNEMKADNLSAPIEEFYGAVGYRVGINFFRATLESGIIVSAKGYYQSLSRTREASETVADASTNYKYELDLKNWAIGFDVGYNFTSYLSWKIVDGTINFNNVNLTNTVNSPGNSDVTKYKSDSGVIGYTVGTGIIVSLVKDYVSLEGLAGYTHLQLEDIKTDDGISFMDQVPENGNFIEAGGFTAVLQLNVGFPL